MTYADIAAKNRLPEDQQPHPDPNLLEGEHHSSTDAQHPDLSHSTATEEKVHVVTREEFDQEQHAFEDEPAQYSSRPAPVRLGSSDAVSSPATSSSAGQQAQKNKEQVKKDAGQAKEQVKKDAEQTKEQVKKDAGQAKEQVKKDAEQTKEQVKKDAEQAKEQVKQTAQETTEQAKDKAAYAYAKGQENFDKASQEAKKEYEVLSEKAQKAYSKMSKEAQADWHKLSKESKKRWEEAKNSEAGQELQKPEVWGSLLAVANLAVTGTTIYYAYKHWNRSHWDRRVVSATAIGLATWFGLQGYLIDQSDAVKQRQQRRS